MKIRHFFGYVLIAFLVIGVINDFFLNPVMFIIPIVIFGLIIWLVKRPPAFLNSFFYNLSKNKNGQQYYKASQQVKKQAKTKRDRPRSKTVPFKVIEGGRDDNDTPRYH